MDSNVISELIDNIPADVLKSGMPGNEKQKISQIKMIKQISAMLFKMIPTGINFKAHTTDNFQIWGTLKRESLRESSASLVLKHGNDIHGTWFMSGIIDTLPNCDSDFSANWGTVISSFREMTSPLQDFFGKQKNDIGVTPIAIFRKIPHVKATL